MLKAGLVFNYYVIVNICSYIFSYSAYIDKLSHFLLDGTLCMYRHLLYRKALRRHLLILGFCRSHTRMPYCTLNFYPVRMSLYRHQHKCLAKHLSCHSPVVRLVPGMSVACTECGPMHIGKD